MRRITASAGLYRFVSRNSSEGPVQLSLPNTPIISCSAFHQIKHRRVTGEAALRRCLAYCPNPSPQQFLQNAHIGHMAKQQQQCMVPMASVSFHHTFQNIQRCSTSYKRQLTNDAGASTNNTNDNSGERASRCTKANSCISNTSTDSTFYRRPLPSTCIAFSSPEGRALFSAALHEGGLKSYFSLAEHYVTQTEPAFCGLSTLSMCLNALGIDPGTRWKGVWRWYDEEMLQCCVPIDSFKETGISFDEFSALAICNGVRTRAWRAQDSDIFHFRQLLESVTLDTTETPYDCPANRQKNSQEVTGGQIDKGKWQTSKTVKEPNPQILVVSYDRRVLGQTGLI